MTFRRLRGILLIVMLLSAVGWLVISIHQLVTAATVYHERVLDPIRLSTTRSTAAQASLMKSDQLSYGEHTMTAVALVALVLVMLFIHSFWRPPVRPRQSAA